MYPLYLALLLSSRSCTWLSVTWLETVCSGEANPTDYQHAYIHDPYPPYDLNPVRPGDLSSAFSRSL